MLIKLLLIQFCILSASGRVFKELNKNYSELSENVVKITEVTNKQIISQNSVAKKENSDFSEFPPDFMSDEVRAKGGFVVHIIIFAYISLAMAVVCDVYFLESLEFISSALNLPSDIAGATFMAIGTSAPELFISIIGVFISDTDIGTGTIVGSAVFNLLVIPGACGFAAYYNLKEMPKITAFPIIRDTIFYIVTVVTLILCIKDQKVDWVESLSLVSLYLVYILFMYFYTQYSTISTETMHEDVDEKIPEIKNENSPIDVLTGYGDNNSNIDFNKTENGKESNNNIFEPEFNDDTKDDLAIEWTQGRYMRWLLMPMTFLFRITLPKPTKFCFIFTFLISIVWIGLLTYLNVWMVTLIGFSIGIPDTVAGITILAAGTSTPELISSYILVKKFGLADMAICNSIGSNIIDILFCLGIPWLLKSLINIFTMGIGSSNVDNTSVQIYSNALPLTSLTLLATAFAMVFTFKFTNWRLGLSVGIVCTIVYIVFIAVSTVLELYI